MLRGMLIDLIYLIITGITFIFAPEKAILPLLVTEMLIYINIAAYLSNKRR